MEAEKVRRIMALVERTELEVAQKMKALGDLNAAIDSMLLAYGGDEAKALPAPPAATPKPAPAVERAKAARKMKVVDAEPPELCGFKGQVDGVERTCSYEKGHDGFHGFKD